MENLILEAAKVLWAKSDPMLVLCYIILAVLQYRHGKRLDTHLDPDPDANPYPYPQCKEGETAYKTLREELKQQHRENREDHRGIFRLLRGSEE